MNSRTADNIKIKRNKYLWGFDSNLKVGVSNKQLRLMEVYSYLSPRKIYFFNPFFVCVLTQHQRKCEREVGCCTKDGSRYYDQNDKCEVRANGMVGLLKHKTEWPSKDD